MKLFFVRLGELWLEYPKTSWSRAEKIGATNLAWTLPRLSPPLTTLITSLFSKPAPIWRHLLPLRSSRHDPRSSKVKDQEELAATSSTKGPRWSIQSPHCVFKLTVCREVASRQQTTSRSQKRTPTGNTATSQAIHIQKWSYPGSTGTSLPSNKQHPQGQKSMCLHCSLCSVIPLTWSRLHSVHRSFTSHRKPRGNGNEGKKLDIFLLKTETGLLRSDREPRLQAALLKKEQQATPVRRTLVRSNIGPRPEGGLRNTSNKTARSGKTSNRTAG